MSGSDMLDADRHHADRQQTDRCQRTPTAGAGRLGVVARLVRLAGHQIDLVLHPCHSTTDRPWCARFGTQLVLITCTPAENLSGCRCRGALRCLTVTRIVGGLARGRRLAVPPLRTRPTSDRAREALFNTLRG